MSIPDEYLIQLGLQLGDKLQRNAAILLPASMLAMTQEQQNYAFA